MRHACGGGGKFKLITFTIKLRCPKGTDVTQELNTASIDLADNDLNFELKSIKCTHDAKDLVALMTYNAMGKEYTEKILNLTLNSTHKKHVHSLTISVVKKERMLKEELVVKTTLEYPTYGEFKQYKKGAPRPKYTTTNKSPPSH